MIDRIDRFMTRLGWLAVIVWAVIIVWAATRGGGS